MSDFKKDLNGNDEPNKQGSSSALYNLYDRIPISIRTLDFIIAGLAIAIIAVLVYGMKTGNGFTVTFNTLGGTSIESQNYEYGEYVEVEDPTREGYEFDHWALDEACTITAHLDTMIVDTDFTLYACWEEK